MRALAGLYTIERVIRQHGQRLREEVLREVKGILDVTGVPMESTDTILVNSSTSLDLYVVTVEAQTGPSRAASIRGVIMRSYDLEKLSDRYPDCAVFAEVPATSNGVTQDVQQLALSSGLRTLQ